ncbi:Ada metal-binding domain-containing protein [Dyadobacter sp. CY312]|uniref:Ada metal-binding domain-containing protein n=1 Tax=Dyadobacter sp. CY312 TaxID=2907303 RepID=UPI001F484F52|nr:Ada metal-binding domain-containing protein [Dyadobacter sp. CY312]MCE7043236.1 metal-binding protein [Dyadobacter sp. CY312]
MIRHLELDSDPIERQRRLQGLIRRGEVCLGGYARGKIYGLLSCSAGKRMKIENRVFFKNEDEAIQFGYRPCGRCLPEKYRLWKLKTHGN